MKRISYLLALVVLLLAALACETLSLPGLGSAQPEAGAIFRGDIEMGSAGSRGELRFQVTDDGANLTNFYISVMDLVCGSLTVGQIDGSMGNRLITLDNGRFDTSLPSLGNFGMSSSKNYRVGGSPADFPTIDSLETTGQFEGKFTSGTEAEGTILLTMAVLMTDRACELGTFPWSAEAP
jgi:hypothetical protein